MEPAGWALFLISNATVIALGGFCFYKVLSIPQEHMHSPLDIDTRDREEDSES